MSAERDAERNTERYTVVLGGLYEGERLYLTLAEDGESRRHEGVPPAWRLRGGIPFEELPESARESVLAVYREVWGL